MYVYIHIPYTSIYTHTYLKRLTSKTHPPKLTIHSLLRFFSGGCFRSVANDSLASSDCIVSARSRKCSADGSSLRRRGWEQQKKATPNLDVPLELGSMVSKWVISPTYKWGIPWGYNPLTNHLLTSWDIHDSHPAYFFLVVFLDEMSFFLLTERFACKVFPLLERIMKLAAKHDCRQGRFRNLQSPNSKFHTLQSAFCTKNLEDSFKMGLYPL